ncbi:tyrosine-protein phosphatase [Desulfovibrio sp. OttesenSCG-928-I05]|nr:tyrosine-protein phosphatase [Desulfovibrio sp. OttesenSCG-928-I05]
MVDDSSRLLALAGAYNVRDMGGYALGGGRHFARGKVFRSGDLDALTQDDLTALATRGLRTVVDFREDAERLRSPDKLPSTVTDVYALPIQPGALSALRELPADADQVFMMQVLYRALVREAVGEYREFFRILMQDSSSPLLFHCSAGKDRTGLGAALLLTALGADRELVYHDYLLSAEYLKEKYRQYLEDPAQANLFTVRREYLDAAFAEMEENYGGVENYLTRELGADPDRLVQLFAA